jgi:hypothetical protein
MDKVSPLRHKETKAIYNKHPFFVSWCLAIISGLSGLGF